MKTDKKLLFSYIFAGILCLVIFIICICIGSVNVPLKDTLNVFLGIEKGMYKSIILSIRLPRVLCVALTGASLSLCGAAMQGLLKNPLADGSTLGVSGGASLGAVLSIALGITIPGFAGGGTMLMAILFAFASLILILSLSYKLDYSLSTNTIILTGVIFSMFTSSLMSLILAFSSEKIKTITFWTMGSLANSSYTDMICILAALLIFGTVIIAKSRELNAFSISEENAMHIGVNVKKTKLVLLICVSVIIGVCVSVGGTIGFLGLVIPHMTRMIIGPDHKKLLPVCVLSGAIGLMLCDLLSRTIISPIELPIGVITSFIGSVVFTVIFFKTRKVK